MLAQAHRFEFMKLIGEAASSNRPSMAVPRTLEPPYARIATRFAARDAIDAWQPGRRENCKI